MNRSTPKLTDEQKEFYKLLIIRCAQEKTGQPWITYAFHNLTPVNAPGLKTMAIDKKWRVYVDFEYMMDKGVEYASGVLNHEPWHVLRRHTERFEALGLREDGRKHDHKLWNYAGDLTINGDIPNLVPEDGLFPEKGEFKDYQMNDSAENYYFKMLQDEKFAPKTCPDCGQPLEDDGKKKDDKKSKQDQGKDAGKDKGDQDGGDQDGGKDGSDGDQDGDSGSNGESGENGESGDASGEGQGEGSGDADGDGGEGSGEGQGNGHGGSSGSHTCNTCGQGTDGAPGGNGGNGGGKFPGVNCGSGSGNPGDYELGSEYDDLGVPEDEADGIIKATAEQIRQYGESNGIGKLPGNARLWADEILTAPPLDWRTILRGYVKFAVAWKKGQLDRNRSKRNRRQANPDIITPAWAAPKPRLAVAFDTSGSNLHNLGVVVDEIENIVKSVGVRGRDLLAFGVDVNVSDVKPVNNPRKVLEDMNGGGGTDMRVGFEQLGQLGRQGKADVGVLITDLQTGWPDQAPTGKMKYIVIGIVNGSSWEQQWIDEANNAIGDWAKVLIVDTSEEG